MGRLESDLDYPKDERRSQVASKQTEYTVSSQILSEYLGSLFLVMAAISPIIRIFRSKTPSFMAGIQNGKNCYLVKKG